MGDDKDIHRFSADRPIQKITDDLLGRKKFAESLSKAIISWRGRDSLVVALYGIWGCGKSSVKNMVIDAIRKHSQSSPEIVDFNPWQWAGQKGLLEAFFQEIALALGKADKSNAGKKRAVKWRFYGALLSTGSSMCSGLSSILPWLLLVISALGIGASLFEVPWFRLLSVIFLVICFIATSIFKWGGNFSDQISNLFSFYADIQSKSLEEVKAELKDDLSKLKNPLLVVIDDIDRLSKDESRLLMQLVKANADFPNIVYLLIFQRDIVEKNLGSENLSGKQYLEKIIQVPFDIPQADQLKIERVLFAGLDRILEEDDKILKRFDKSRWGNIYIPGLRPYFRTLRNIYRYLSTLSFHISLLKGDIAFEVNPIDIIALEALRIFEPDVYSAISQNKVILTNIFHQDEQKEEPKADISSIIDRASVENKEYVREIIRQIFPTIECALGRSEYGSGTSEKWFQDLRVCHPDVFSRYFQLTIPERDLSQSELDDLISKSNDQGRLREAFDRLQERDLIDVALNRLDSYKEKVPIQNALPFVTTILNISDHLPTGRAGFFEIGPYTNASRIVYWYLKQEPDPDKRGGILYDSLLKSDGLSLAATLIALDEPRREKAKDQDDHLFSDKQIERLKGLFVTKVQKVSLEDPEKLAENQNLIAILYQWLHWGDSENVREWIDQFTKNEKYLLAFLSRITREVKSHGMGDYVYKTGYEIDLKTIEDFIRIETIKQRLSNINTGSIDERAANSIKAFEKSIRLRNESKSSDSPNGDE